MSHRNLASRLFIVFLGLFSTTPASSQAHQGMLVHRYAAQTEELELNWWNEHVFYEIFIRSFNDSDGDGIGDLQGIIDKLDYLSDLGITGIWLMPPAESPSYHGYDTTDYYTVEPDYGTNDDMKRLIEAAHARGIAVIVDMVVNHSSNEHPWFLASAAGEEPYTDWYIWSEDNPGYRGPWNQQVWHPLDGNFYYGIFSHTQPDLDYTNPDVTQAMYDIATFWLNDMGVDGFRLDAIKHIIEEGERQENVPASREWLTAYDDHLESVKPNTFTVGEWFGTPSFLVGNYIKDGAADMGFDFELAEAMISTGRRGQARVISRAHDNAVKNYPPNQFATFLTNHDQNRAAFQLRGNVDHMKVAAALLLTGPGVPFIYYGEELGMKGAKPDERIRTPMHWENSEMGGFTTGNRLWEPLQDPQNVAKANVADQLDDPDSLLNHYRSLIHARNANPALQKGDMTIVDASERSIYAFLRHTDEQTVLVVMNLGQEPITDFTLALESSDLDLAAPTLIYGDGEATPPTLNDMGGFVGYKPLEELEPYSIYIFEFRS